MSEYLDTLVSGFWDYQQKVFPIWEDYFDQPKKSNRRPPVFLKNKADHNILMEPGISSQRKMIVKNQIPPLIDKWQKIIGVEVNDWGIKKMKTKWGTCTIEKRRIWLNLELAKKSDNCLEYIVVHEMVHLIERKHSDRFVGYMDKFMPRWHFYPSLTDITIF